jgi:hypothetical protein
MTTATNLLVILTFLSALYTLLGLLCVVVEGAQALLARPHRRRIARRVKRRPMRPRRANGGRAADRPPAPAPDALRIG